MQAPSDITTAYGPASPLSRYSLLDALRGRRSRRFGVGMKIPDGPFTYTSTQPVQSLSEEEEAALAFAACGITGPALADLSYGRGQGGGMLSGLVGRTIASPDAINTVSLVVTNDQATYLLKRPQDFARNEIAELIHLAKEGELLQLYQRSRIQIANGRTVAPLEPGYNFNINKWSLYAPGSTYFLPINEITAFYINALLESFDAEMGYFIRDERANFQPAGIARFARSKGGHLHDADPNRTATVGAIEQSLVEAAAVEQGMMLQNLGLMGQALGLGGFPNFARHEFGWFKALGFRLEEMPASRYLGASGLISGVLGLLGRDPQISYPVMLERNGQTLLGAYCPPTNKTMEEAVHAFIEYKFGPQGVFRGGATVSGWQDPAATTARIPTPSQQAIDATIAYCEYVYQRYGRFPAYSAPFRTCIGYQATHVDSAFYDRFYHPDALSDTQRNHQALWHNGMAGS